jgi:hypothetical protein
MDLKRAKLYNQIKMCLCVDILWIYMVANPNSTLLLENISLFWNLETFARE